MHGESVACTEAGPLLPHLGHAVQRIGRCSATAPAVPGHPCKVHARQAWGHTRTHYFIIFIFSGSDPTQERPPATEELRDILFPLPPLLSLSQVFPTLALANPAPVSLL